MKRIAFVTLGCKANQVDTDALIGVAATKGFQVVAENEPAEAYLINSCTVTQHADRDTRHEIYRLKRKNPSALIGVMGCYSQVAKEDVLRLSQVDFVVGTANKESLLHSVERALSGSEVARDQVSTPTGFLPEEFLGARQARAPIKIQDGCNFKCSFCIIPRARGRSRSLSIEQVKTQIQQAHAQGFQEVVLTGIHLAHYGWDRGENLEELLREIFREKTGPRVRVSTLDPFEIPDSMLQLLENEPRFCPHFHIALQSGSDRVLSRMRRIYKASEFFDVTHKIQRTKPDAFIGVDVIVGFPGETDEEYSETRSLLEHTPWSKLHVFPYSDRRETAASEMKEKVSFSVASKRSAELRALSEKRYETFLDSQIGNTKTLLIERPDKKEAGYWSGHTENYVPVRVKGENLISKTLARVLLNSRQDQFVVGSYASAPDPSSLRAVNGA